MSVLLNGESSPQVTSPTKAAIFASTDLPPLLKVRTQSGGESCLTDIVNSSLAAQSIAATTRTYIAGSALTLPATDLKTGAVLQWSFNLTKTAAGTATSTIDVAFGTTGTVADTARITFTKPAGTAVADEAKVDITVVIRLASATGTASAEFTLIHNGNTVGHATIPCVVQSAISAAFDMTTPTRVGICITTGASDVITIQQVVARATGL
jgi:predicted RecA/RadA family phage recombinase